MLQTFTVSNEVISVDVSRELGKLVQAQIGKMRESFDNTGVVSTAELTKLGEIVKMTGLNVEFISTPGDYPDAWMMTFQYWGHQGTTWSKYIAPESCTSKNGLKYVTKVDLKKLQVSGPFVDELKFRSNIASAFFLKQYQYTDEEITGILLHEIGHAFNLFVTLSDYIYLNYMLTDGIDVLLGNKRNEYDLEILDHTWVMKNIDPKQREEYVNGGSPEKARRAIISLYKRAPRHYLFENPGSAHRREEQMADMFASRLGYGRALATGLHRMYKDFGYDMDQRASLLGNILRLLAAIAFLPITILWLATVSGTNDFNFGDRYDPPGERVLKVRLELVNQLRNIKDVSAKATIQKDIDVLDELLKEYHKGKDLFDYMAELASPVLRRERSLITHEENLEYLLNNSLFVEAARFKS